MAIAGITIDGEQFTMSFSFRLTLGDFHSMISIFCVFWLLNWGLSSKTCDWTLCYTVPVHLFSCQFVTWQFGTRQLVTHQHVTGACKHLKLITWNYGCGVHFVVRSVRKPWNVKELKIQRDRRCCLMRVCRRRQPFHRTFKELLKINIWSLNFERYFYYSKSKLVLVYGFRNLKVFQDFWAVFTFSRCAGEWIFQCFVFTRLKFN